MKLLFLPLFFFFLLSCATNSKRSVAFIDTPTDNCAPVASLSAFGFNVFPPIASSLAKSMLEEKAEEYEVNAIQITKKEGLFQVRYEAMGYRCF